MMANEVENVQAGPPSPYEDVPIDIESRCIRLVTIRKNAQGGIECHLSVHDIDDEKCPEWMCLSYTWDTYDFDATELTWQRSPTQLTKEITVNGLKVEIRESLYVALVHILQFVYGEEVGKPDDPEKGPYDYENSKMWKYFWIDAMAIDQKNLLELSHQVGIMTEIFSQARAVMCWLAPAKGISSEGLKDAIQELMNRHRWEETYYSDPFSWYANFEHGMPPSVDELPNNLRIHCQALEKHPYWGRMWIVQEITLARSIAYFYGTGFPIHEKASTPLSMPIGRTSWSTSFMPSTNLQGALAQRSAWRNQIQKGETKWWDLLYLHQHKRCADPRDMVYGLLGMMPGDLPIKADYTITTPELFFLLVKEMNENPVSAMLDDPPHLISFCLSHLGLGESPMVSGLADFAVQDVPPDFVRKDKHDSQAELGLWILRHTEEQLIFEASPWSTEGPRGWLNYGEGRPILDRYHASLDSESSGDGQAKGLDSSSVPIAS